MKSLPVINCPGSFNNGLSFNKEHNVKRTLFNVWHADHLSPLHVFNIETHTLPHLYKFGLNRVTPLFVMYFTFGGENG